MSRLLAKAGATPGSPRRWTPRADTVLRTRQRLVEEGVDGALTYKYSSASARPRIFDGAAEAKLIALACGEPPPLPFHALMRAEPWAASPKSRARWTLQLLEEQVVELKIVERASDNTIGWTLKNALKPHLQKQWVIAPDANAAFVVAMEVYQRPQDPGSSVVCLDETSKQLIKETRMPVAAKPGQPARTDYEYERNGTANLFMMFAPLEGWRQVKVTDRHAAIDYAHILKELSDPHFPGAAKIVLVQDNLSTHKPASLYEAFPPGGPPTGRTVRVALHAQARSWLDMAGSELSVFPGNASTSASPISLR